MKVIGIVQGTNWDANGNPIAWVRPLVEIRETEWRSINATEEFPTRGLVFWPNAWRPHTRTAAIVDELISCRTEESPHPTDQFRVVDPRLVQEVLDLRRYGGTTDVRGALVEGVRISGPVGALRAMAWCEPNVLVGPVDLVRTANGTVKLSGANLARVPSFTAVQLHTIRVNGDERRLFFDESTPSGYVDWDDNAAILRRALEISVRVAKRTGRDAAQTKKQIEETSRALAEQGIGPDSQLERYRLERALALLENTDLIARSAGELAELLREHPSIKVSLDEFSAKVRADVEQSARVELEQRLAREREALKETTEAHARTKSELAVREQELRRAEEHLTEVRGQVASAAKEAEAAVDARVLAALDRPLELLAEVSVLRPFMGAGGIRVASAPTSPTASTVDWSRARGEDIEDKASLRRILTSAARARGVDPSLMVQVHAAVVARLMPITLGPSALAALTAYAHGACGTRVHIVHVSPSAIQPHDFDELPGGGLVAAAAAAKDIDGISVVVLEGANRSPLEASVLPLLQLTEVGLSPLSSARGLRLGASLVVGATTVPVTPQLWSHAAAIYPEPNSPSPQTGAPGDVALSSELLVPGDEPTEVIDALLEAWPHCRELRPTMSRFGSALNRLYDDEPRVTDALLHGLVLPYVATALTIEEQAEALEAGDADGSLALVLRRLRRSLA